MKKPFEYTAIKPFEDMVIEHYKKKTKIKNDCDIDNIVEYFLSTMTNEQILVTYFVDKILHEEKTIMLELNLKYTNPENIHEDIISIINDPEVYMFLIPPSQK